jgi:cell division protein FtsW
MLLFSHYPNALQQTQKQPALDGALLAVVGALIGLGLVMVTSSSLAIAEGKNVSHFYYLIRHFVALGLGGALGFLAYKVNLKWLEQQSQILVLLAVLMLLLVFVPGLSVRINGASRWVRLGFTNFQMVEAVKLILIIYLAGYCVRHAPKLQSSFTGVLKPMGVAGLLMVLLLLQPDFGGATLVLTITLGIIWLGGACMRRLGLLAALVLPLMGVVALAEPYRVRRLTTFLNPWADPFNDGFQLTQALIAVGRGEWLGVGLGQSIQKLFYLPEAHSDFILAVIAEELGFFGVILVLGLFAAFAARAFQLGLQALRREQPFAAFIAYGIGLWFSVQTIISVGVNLGVLPTKGLTLPLISAGGSSVIMSLAAVGLLMRVSADVRAVNTRRESAP